MMKAQQAGASAAGAAGAQPGAEQKTDGGDNVKDAEFTEKK
jgi:hypothetical protein